MRVALVASSYAPSIGGVEEVVRELSAELARRGVESVVLTNRWPRDLPRHEVIDGVEVYRLAFRSPEPSPKAVVTYHLTHSLVERATVSILRRHRIGVVNVHCVSTNGHYARIAAQRLGLPLVITAHGELTMDEHGAYEKSKFLNRTLRGVLRCADAITACSHATLADLEHWFGGQFSDRACVIPNGISLEDFPDSESSAVDTTGFVLAIGRLVHQKGFDVLLHAHALAAREPDFTLDLVIAGAGSQLTNLHALARELEIADRVHLVGPVGRKAVASLLRRCAFVIVPSRVEPFGIVSLEAMASKKAVIATCVGGIPEVVMHGKTGLLVRPEDPAGLAHEMLRVTRDQRLRDELGAAGRREAATRSWDTIGAAYEATYAVALRRARIEPS